MTQRLLYEYKLPWLSKVGARQEVTTLNKINRLTSKNTKYETIYTHQGYKRILSS